jgi:glyoxylate/hydroxypyruvate/2-ketogluconate reductase
MKPKVFVTQSLPLEVAEWLGPRCELRVWESGEKLSREALLNALSDVEGVALANHRVDEEFLAHAPRLRVVSDISVGYDNFDIDAMRRHGILGTNTPGVLDDTVADLVMGLILASARRIPELDRYVKEGRWTRAIPESLFGRDVHHATLGIIGLGRIGEAVARRARFGFDMEVVYHNRHRNEGAEERTGARFLALDEVLARADFLVLQVPSTAETRGFFGSREFGLMKASSIFVNASRGDVVDEEALVAALRSGRIVGAALDVFSREPIAADNPLLGMANVIALPHVGSATSKTRADMCMLAAKNLVAALEGEIPPNLVPELGKQ